MSLDGSKTRAHRRCGIELERSADQRHALTRAVADRDAQHPPRCRLPDGTPRLGMTCLEPMDELDERGHGSLGELRGKALSGSDLPGKVDVVGRELRGHASDLAPRDLELEVALNVASALRRLLGMDAVEEKRLRLVGAVADDEQPRPEVVILALEIARVVAQTLALEQLTIDEHGRMEEGRAEEEMPAHL